MPQWDAIKGLFFTFYYLGNLFLPESRATTDDSENEVEDELEPSSDRESRAFASSSKSINRPPFPIPVARPRPKARPAGSSAGVQLEEQGTPQKARTARISTGLTDP